jgi:hypothetical protein
MSGGGAFDEAWAGVRQYVLAYCRRHTRTASDAEDLCQRIAVRAWRGHPTFRGDSAYLTWIMRIAEREAVRFAAGPGRIGDREIAYEEIRERVDSVVAGIDGPEPENRAGWLGPAVELARDRGAVSPAEYDVVTARLTHPDESWERLGGRLGLTTTGCAVAHCRAVPKLRVFLFDSMPHLLGGVGAISDAFARASAATDDPLTPAESDAFRMIVLHGRSDYRRRGSRIALRGACAKVIRYLEPP